MLEVGEKVRFLDEEGWGIILRFLDARTVVIKDEWNMEFQYPISKLVPAERDRVPEKPKAPVQQRVEPPKTVAPVARPTKCEPLPELALAFVSTSSNKPETGDLDLILVNNSKYHLLANVAAKENEEWFSLFAGEMQPRSQQLVQSLRRQDVGLVGNVNVDVLFFGKTGYVNREPVSCTLKIKVTRFVKPGNYCSYEGLENPAMAIAVENEKRKVVAAVNVQRSRPVQPIKKPSLAIMEDEVDLHLECILGHDPADMTDHEKFLTQMRHFELKLNEALREKYLQITFIHGVGTGRLKEAVREMLQVYELDFEDGAFHKYGVGATVVRFGGKKS